MKNRHESASPPVFLERLPLNSSIHVVRDDLLDGGTKQRAALPYLRDLQKAGVQEVVYASPFAGFAQVALAKAAQELRLPCRLFAERDLCEDREIFHPFTKLACSYGAEVSLASTLAQAEEQAVGYIAAGSGREKIPLGFADPRFHHYLRRAIAKEWESISARVPVNRVWLPVGSATLARAFRSVVPEAVELLCVNVHVLPATDHRIREVEEMANSRLFAAEEVFAEKSRVAPPVPSNVHYDAKLWPFIAREGRDHDLWWNVAR